jgi:hypothetical protein
VQVELIVVEVELIAAELAEVVGAELTLAEEGVEKLCRICCHIECKILHQGLSHYFHKQNKLPF